MICPKCDRGNIEGATLKGTDKKVHLCDFCESLWFEGEVINIYSGHKLQSFSRGEELECIADIPP